MGKREIERYLKWWHKVDDLGAEESFAFQAIQRLRDPIAKAEERKAAAFEKLTLSEKYEVAEILRR